MEAGSGWDPRLVTRIQDGVTKNDPYVGKELDIADRVVTSSVARLTCGKRLTTKWYFHSGSADVLGGTRHDSCHPLFSFGDEWKYSRNKPRAQILRPEEGSWVLGFTSAWRSGV